MTIRKKPWNSFNFPPHWAIYLSFRSSRAISRHSLGLGKLWLINRNPLKQHKGTFTTYSLEASPSADLHLFGHHLRCSSVIILSLPQCPLASLSFMCNVVLRMFFFLKENNSLGFFVRHTCFKAKLIKESIHVQLKINKKIKNHNPFTCLRACKPTCFQNDVTPFMYVRACSHFSFSN